MAKFKVLEPSNEKLEELAMISKNLRFYSKVWGEHFGSYNKIRMVFWQKKMDQWLEQNIEKIE